MATIVSRSAAKAASASNNASSSADGSLTASPAVVATQGAQLIFPSHSKDKSDKIISSAEATQLAHDRLALLAVESIPAPGSDGGLDGPPPAKAGRTEDPNVMDVCVAETPVLIHESQKAPGTPPTSAVPTHDEIAALVASSMEQARRENQSKVDADNKILLQTMTENSRRETGIAISACVKDITTRIGHVEVSVANTEKLLVISPRRLVKYRRLNSRCRKL